MQAGGLLILVAGLLITGSFLELAEFQSAGDRHHSLRPFRSVWSAWHSGRASRASPEARQVLGVGMIAMAIAAVLGGVLLLTGLGATRRMVRAVEVACAAMAFGAAATLTGVVGSAPMTTRAPIDVSLGSGFWVVVVTAVLAAAALALTMSATTTATAAAPRDAYGRPLSPRASGSEIAVGALSLTLAVVMIPAMFFSQLDIFGPSISLWRVADKVQVVGVPFALGVLALVFAAVLSFTGRGRTLSTAAAGFLFAAGQTVLLNTVSQALFGPVRLDDFGIGFWVLLAATVLALLVMVLAIAAAASTPRYRSPYAPAASANTQENGHNAYTPGMPPPGYVHVQSAQNGSPPGPHGYR